MSHKCGTYAQRLQDMVNKYREEVHGGPLDLAEIAHWMIREDQWKPPRRDAAKILQRDIARALREEYCDDPQGRRVRRKHAFRVKDAVRQQTFWVDLFEARPKEIRLAFQQRRRSILGDCTQLSTDVASYNDNNAFHAHIQMSFNFETDLAELNESTEYPGLDSNPEDDFEVDDEEGDDQPDES
jgi:hypothetical protein